MFPHALYRLLLACFDARESAGSRRTTIAVTSALIVGLSAVVLCVLPDWAYGRPLFPEPFWNTARIYSYAYFFAAFFHALPRVLRGARPLFRIRRRARIGGHR